MQRRNLLLGAAAATLARPAIGGTAKTLTFVPQSPLASLDPVWTSAMTTRNVGFMIYDVLFGRDADMNPKPQMLAGYVVEDDGKRWVMTLRENLWFHDGERVLARDCTASLRRWMKRDPAGATLEARLDALEAPDDRTIVLRLNKRFPALPKLLSKFQTAAVMVPERIANGTDPFKQMTEIVGSGPFRFLKDEYVIGSHAALVPFERYVPRDEPASFTSGGHRVMVDRVEWKMIPDPATAAIAMVTGEVDWLEMPMPDLLPTLRQAPNVMIGRLDQWGFISQLRPNHVTAPTDNVKLRRAIMAAIDQRAVMDAIMGGDPGGTIVPMGYLATGNPDVDLAGIEALTERSSPAEVKAMLEDAGYHGERLVLLHTTDQPFYNSASLVVADALSRVGMTIDDQAMDWGTVLQRRASKPTAGQGRLVAVRQRDAGAGVSRSAAGLAAARQRQGRLDRLARHPAHRDRIQRLAGQRRCRGADAAGARDPAGGVRVGAVHSARPLHAAGGVEQADQRSAEGAGAGVLECEQGVAIVIARSASDEAISIV